MSLTGLCLKLRLLSCCNRNSLVIAVQKFISTEVNLMLLFRFSFRYQHFDIGIDVIAGTGIGDFAPTRSA